MLKKCSILLFVLTLSISCYGQTLNKGEYFFDNDPGTGNGTALTFTSGASINTNFALNISALSTGFHNVNIRLRDNTGKWSHFQSRTFYLAPLTSVTPPSTTVSKLEYFFDNDPGIGNGTNVPITPIATLTQNVVVPITSLTTGFHNLNFRVKDDQGRWSHFATRTFYIVPPLAGSAAVTITKAEYFFDTDPGTGLATPVSVTSAGQINQTIVVPTTSLSPGFHNLNFRVRDDKGKWSHFATRTFYIVPPPATPLATALKKAEYFFDADPGTGNATPVTITSGSPQDNSFALDISSLAPGFHRLAIRYQDNQNHWSQFAVRTFYIVPTDELGAANVERVEYFIDTDPGENPSLTGTALVTTPAPSIDQGFVIDLSGTPQGNHTLYVRVKDDKGFWSTRVAADFTILACTPPTAPAAPPVSRCGPGSLTLVASGAVASQVYRWYDDATTSTILFTGGSFATPSLNATQNYFVSIFDPVTLCESNRTSVTASVNFADKPIVNPSGTLSFCEGSSVILSAPDGFSQYVWSNGESTKQILVGATGKYAVQIGDGSCLSPASDTVYVSVVTAPAKPVITVTGNTTICGTGSVDLTGPVGFEYVWSNGSTTQTITVNQTGVYYLIVKSGGNCPSLPSDPIVVTVLIPPCGGGGPTNQPPVIAPTPFAAQIEGTVQVDLTQIITDEDDNIDYSSLRVIDNITSRGVPATIDGSYFLLVDYSGNPFTGTDRVTLEVCDLAVACVQQVIDIEVVGEVKIYNGLTPDGDGYNDFMVIKYVDVVEGASQNKVTILNRWGDIVWDINDYNNTDRVFVGESNGGQELPSGTYFYKVELGSGKLYTGYITLKR